MQDGANSVQFGATDMATHGGKPKVLVVVGE